MKIKIYFLAAALIVTSALNAQLFVSKATIEYEMKANIQKTMGNGSWWDMIKDQLPTFKTGYFKLTFADNKSVYKFDHWDGKVKLPEFLTKSDEESVWYYNYNAAKLNMQKSVWGSQFSIEDSIPVLEWRVTNENRIIAGFNCRANIVYF